ncbi:hypothetical protein B0T25DRAFT_550451 [Lasiosphaeria hispida]|uniref:Uncharacterized protein n=1 Tax=Lasiosphaeria hispida TaxID=260671 RepID=A0AAJ0HA42_9PEZI|nr:hypothetical protein B0T25DRAFT_550451 [Lasiosphaeria hispida]
MLVVHPAYWKRGHGIQLATWPGDLSVLDKVSQCVSSATMSQSLFTSLAYRQVGFISAEGDEDDPEGVEYRPVEAWRSRARGSLRHEPGGRKAKIP